MVRQATAADIPRLLRMLRNFHDAANYQHNFDAPRTSIFLHGVIASGNDAVFVAGQPINGFLIASRIESPFAPLTSAVERVIWVEPTARGRVWSNLIDAFEAWAHQHGCDNTMLYSQAAMRGSAVGRLFRRRGYQPLETAYSKTL